MVELDPGLSDSEVASVEAEVASAVRRAEDENFYRQREQRRRERRRRRGLGNNDGGDGGEDEGEDEGERPEHAKISRSLVGFGTHRVTLDVDGGLPSSHNNQHAHTPPSSSSSAAAHVVWSDVALSVAQLDGVYVVEPRPLFRLLNKASRIIIGVNGLAAAPPFLASSLTNNAHLPASFVATAKDGSKSVPIDGAGQVVSLLDSGLDTHHCLFKDSTQGTTYRYFYYIFQSIFSLCSV